MCQAEGGAEVFAEFEPVFFGNGEKDFYDIGIELRAGTTLNLFAGMGKWQSFAIRAVADHGVQRVGDGEDAGPERDVVSF